MYVQEEVNAVYVGHLRLRKAYPSSIDQHPLGLQNKFIVAKQEAKMRAVARDWRKIDI